MAVNRRKRSSQAVDPSGSPAVCSSATIMKEQVLEVIDPDFHDFDCTRTETDIKPGQIWAIYDDKDGMPRYYGQISSASTCPFEVQFLWLVYDHGCCERSSLWSSSSGYYVPTGEFELGDLTTSKIINMFSHRMYITEQFTRGASSRFTIYPRKGDVWAMYRDWDEVPLSTEAPSNVTCRFDVVEVLVDYSKKNGLKTVKLKRLSGFRTVFCQQDGPQAVCVWKPSDLLKFSHNVPAVKVKQNKLMGIPKQALELDPAAIPLEYSEVDNESKSDVMEMEPKTKELSRGTAEVELTEAKQNCARPSKKKQQKSATDVMTTPLPSSQGNAKSLQPSNSESLQLDNEDSVTELDEIDERPNPQEILSLKVPHLVDSTLRSSSELSALKSHQPDSEADFYDFNSLRMETEIEVGQIWATYDAIDKMPRIYVRVIQVLVSPFKLVEIWRLQPHPYTKIMKSWMNHTGLAMSCGRFKNDKRDVMGLETFSHSVLESLDKKYVKIYPRKGEVWAMYRNWDLETGRRKAPALRTLHINGCDLVEMLSDFLGEGSLEIVRLAKVSGFKSLFQREGKPVIITNVRPDLMFEFSHSIPARKMYKDDTLWIPCGAVEVDPACLLPNSLSH